MTSFRIISKEIQFSSLPLPRLFGKQRKLLDVHYVFFNFFTISMKSQLEIARVYLERYKI